jgi:hypothetical protein
MKLRYERGALADLDERALTLAPRRVTITLEE